MTGSPARRRELHQHENVANRGQASAARERERAVFQLHGWRATEHSRERAKTAFNYVPVVTPRFEKLADRCGDVIADCEEQVGRNVLNEVSEHSDSIAWREPQHLR